MYETHRTPYVTTRPRNFRTESLFSLKFPRIAQNSMEVCGGGGGGRSGGGGGDASKWVYFCMEMREIEGKFCGQNLGMEMSLFMYGNYAEMRETEGKFGGKKRRHGNEFISVWKFCGNEGNWGKFCGGKNRGMEMSLFMYWILWKWGKLRENSAEKNLGMEMSLFLYGNSAEMRETEGNSAGGGETEAWKWVYFCTEFCGSEGNWGKNMYSNIFIYVSLIGNEHEKMAATKKVKQSLKYRGGGGA